jgi:hypothetical protein
VSESGGDGPGEGRVREVLHREVLRDMPWQIAMSTVVFLVFGVMELFLVPAGNGYGGGNGAGGGAGRISGALGAQTVGRGSGPSIHAIPLAVGILLLICALAILGRQRWAQYALVILGVVAVIDLAVEQRWESVAAIVLLILGAVPMFSIRAHRYLNGTMGRPY